jgi:hypothetical protein
MASYVREENSPPSPQDGQTVQPVLLTGTHEARLQWRQVQLERVCTNGTENRQVRGRNVWIVTGRGGPPSAAPKSPERRPERDLEGRITPEILPEQSRGTEEGFSGLPGQKKDANKEPKPGSKPKPELGQKLRSKPLS